MRKPRRAPQLGNLLQDLESERVVEILGGHRIEAAPGGRYYHWEDIRRRPPPEGLSSKEWWLGIKFARLQGRRLLPLTDSRGHPFSYVLTDEVHSLLHRIDQQAAGRIGLPEDVIDPRDRNRYAVSSLMEEAIASSLLEGAATTRRDARRLLRSGKPPTNNAEHMVVNNYRTMQEIRRDPETPLTVGTILDIHRKVAEGTLDRTEDAGRIQQPGEERVAVGGFQDPDPIFAPPSAEDLPQRIDLLVSFANGEPPEHFVHPVVRAVALHFYLAYLHPFVDGNGRTARALFYRSLLRQGYWLAEYLSISRLLRRAPARYTKAFVCTETDEADFTYFLVHQLEILREAIEELWNYLEAKGAEVRRAEQALRGDRAFNHRQIDLLSRALRRPYETFTIKSHQNTYRITYPTAHGDLMELAGQGLLERRKAGREYRFSPAVERLRELFEGP